MSDLKKTPSVRTIIAWATICFLMLIVFLVVAVPNFITARSTCCGNACINNLRQIDAAANQFALENHKTNGEAISFPNDLTPYIKLNSQGKIPGCPDGGLYSIWRVGRSPTCTLGDKITPAHVLP